jgi:hypothetical protein
MVGLRGLVSAGVGLVLGALLCVLVVAAPALAAGDANRASCPNEGMPGFRSYLADCRAYELVSPSSIDGYFVADPLVSGGGAVIAESLGGAAETANAPGTGAEYSFTRGTSGWLTSPLNPPAPLLGISDDAIATPPLAASSDFGRVLFGLHSAAEPSDAESLYVTEAGGAFKEVGPDVPASSLIGAPGGGALGSVTSTDLLYIHNSYLGGASSDLSHIAFVLYGPASEGEGVTHSYLWPGDSTMRGQEEESLPSLYEYVGTGNSEPKLVGVSDQHALASDTEAHLISQCGTIAGGPFPGARFAAESYNDVSADGSVVFFTAMDNPECSGEQPPVNELYARVGGEKTVAVSEPSLGYCKGSPSPPCAAAQFAGASEDGSRVLFTTSQSLLSEDEGGAGNGNDLYEAEIKGGVRTGLVQVSHDPEGPLAAAEVQGVARVSEDGSHVYFVARGVLTSTPNTSLAPGQQVAVAGQDNLYVYEHDSAFPNGHVAFVAHLAESDSEDWQTFDSRRPVDLTPNGRFLLFVSSADLTPGDTSAAGQVFRYDAQTGTVVRVSIGQGGFNENGNTASFAASFPTQEHANFSSARESTRAMSDDGQYVFFQSPDALTPQALEGQPNVYEYHDGEVTLVSDGQDRSVVTVLQVPSVGLVGTDSSGQDVFFTTADQLTPEDGSTQQVVYDARIEGGFPGVSPAECSGDGCQGALSASPAVSVGGSASQSAEGDLAPPPVAIAKAKPKPVSARSKQLARARRVCAREHGKRRRKCEARARAHARAGSRAAKSNGRNR